MDWNRSTNDCTDKSATIFAIRTLAVSEIFFLIIFFLLLTIINAQKLSAWRIGGPILNCTYTLIRMFWKNILAKSMSCWWWIIRTKLIGWWVGYFVKNLGCSAIAKRMRKKLFNTFRPLDGLGNLLNSFSWSVRTKRIRKLFAGKLTRFSTIPIHVGCVVNDSKKKLCLQLFSVF